jgi:hypothetical protein
MQTPAAFIQAAAAAAAAGASGANPALPPLLPSLQLLQQMPPLPLQMMRTMPAMANGGMPMQLGAAAGLMPLPPLPASASITAGNPAPADKQRDAILWEPSLTYAQAFAVWVRDRQRERVFTDEHHAEVIRVLDQRLVTHKRYKGWIRAGYFVVAQPDGTKALYIRCKVEKAAPRGATAGPALAAQQAAASAAAAAEAQLSAQAQAQAIANFTPPSDSAMQTEDASDPLTVQAMATAAAIAAAQISVHAPTKMEVRRVLAASEIPPEIARTHEANHGGTRSLYFTLSSKYHGIPRVACEAFVSRCQVCSSKSTKDRRATGNFDLAAAAHSAVANLKLEQADSDMGATMTLAAPAPPRNLTLKRPAGMMSSPADVLAAANFANINMEGKKARFVASAAAASAAMQQQSALAAAAAANPQRPPPLSAFTSVSLEVISAFWSEQMRPHIQRLLQILHPQPSNFDAAGSEVHAAIRRPLSITPLATHELAMALGSLMGHMLCGLEQQIQVKLRSRGIYLGQLVRSHATAWHLQIFDLCE